MSNKRSLTEDFIINYVEKIAPGIGNKDIYQNFFSQLDDEQFKQFIDKLDKTEIKLAIFIPNSKATVVSMENNLELGKELGHKFFNKIFFSGKEGVPDHVTPVEYLVIDLPFRRVSQLISKKIKIPKNNKVIDTLSGQPTGSSKGAKISYPELLLLASMGLDNSIDELITIRGGDNRAFMAYNNFIDKYGKVTLKGLDDFRSTVKSTTVLKTFLTAMHLKSNLV
jgi:hypothetical protein